MNDPAVAQLLAIGVAALTAFAVQQGLLLAIRLWPRTETRLAALLAAQFRPHRASQFSIGDETPMEMQPDQVILSSLSMPAGVRLGHLRLAGALWPLPALLAGVPPVPVLALCVLSGAMTHSFLASRWTRFTVGLEKELSPFAARLHSALMVTSSVQVALSRAIESLDPNTSPLRLWMERLSVGLASRGTPFLLASLPAARAISPSLALMVLLLERCASAGGAAHAQAFVSASHHLGQVIEARGTAHAKAAKARGTVTIFLILMGVLAALMASQPALREGFRDPIVQLAIAGSVVVMLAGYLIIQAMIRDALTA